MVSLIVGVALAFIALVFLPGKSLAKTRVEVNAFSPNVGYNTASLSGLESTLGVRFTAAMWYQDWSGSFDPTPANNLHASGHLPELTWEPQLNGNGVAFDDVVAGNYDGYLTNFGQAVAALGYPIRISLAPEMNTDWTPWGMGLHGNNPTNFKAFYQHVVQKFRDAGATNVVWVWSPNVTPSNADQLYGGNLGNLYPGDGYVDLMGLDGYNWGSSQSWSVWQSFAQVFQSSYQQLLGVSGKNIVLMEVASAEAGGSKAAWISDMFSQLQNGYGRIIGFTWFNINKETDWRITSSPSAQAAFTAGYNGTVTTGATTSGSSSGSAATSATHTVQKTKTLAPATGSASTSPVTPTPAAAASPADQKYPVMTPLPAKIAGSTVVSAATAKQLTNPERALLISTLLAGLLAIAFLTVRRYQVLHYAPAPVAAVIDRVERWLGFGHVDGVFHRDHFERYVRRKHTRLR